MSVCDCQVFGSFGLVLSTFLIGTERIWNGQRPHHIHSHATVQSAEPEVDPDLCCGEEEWDNCPWAIEILC